MRQTAGEAIATVDNRSRRPRRCWLQFGLKSLIFLTFAVSVACAWLAAQREEKRRERATVESLSKVGIHVFYDWQKAGRKEPSGPQWLRKLLGDNFFSEPIRAFARGPLPTDDALRQLASLLSLRELGISDSVSDRGADFLSSLPRLKSLSIDGPFHGAANLDLTDRGAESLAKLQNLEWLAAARTGLGDGAVEHLAKLAKLRSLQVQRTKFTPAGLTRLQQLLPATQILPSPRKPRAAPVTKAAVGR